MEVKMAVRGHWKERGPLRVTLRECCEELGCQALGISIHCIEQILTPSLLKITSERKQHSRGLFQFDFCLLSRFWRATFTRLEDSKETVERESTEAVRREGLTRVIWRARQWRRGAEPQDLSDAEAPKKRRPSRRGARREVLQVTEGSGEGDWSGGPRSLTVMHGLMSVKCV